MHLDVNITDLHFTLSPHENAKIGSSIQTYAVTQRTRNLGVRGTTNI